MTTVNPFKWIERLAPAPLPEISPAEAHQRLAAGALLIDVREPSEWAEVHAKNARHIPLGQLGQHLAGLPRDREILFICRSGRRSASATAEAQRAGLVSVQNVRGGTLAWVQAGLPTVNGGARGR